MARSCHLLLPGDWHTPTGGYRYDRRIAHGLAACGWQVRRHALDASFPFPQAQALADAQAQVADIPDGAVVVADGLAFGAMPQIAQAHARRLRWVALVHHPLHLETGLDAAARQRLFDSEGQALACARRIVVTSSATAEALAAFGLDAAHIAVVEPGCDLPAPAPRGMRGAPKLLCVATLTPRKGHRVLLEALAGLRDRDWTLDCVGSASRDVHTAAALRDDIARLQLGARVQLHGEVDDATLAGHYASADVFVLASHFEGYGMVFAEALAHGLPVVATEAGAAAQLVPQDAGLLVPPGDAAALRKALAGVLDDAPRRARMARAAKAAASQLPTWDDAARRFAAVLDAAAAQPLP